VLPQNRFFVLGSSFALILKSLKKPTCYGCENSNVRSGTVRPVLTRADGVRERKREREERDES
jgi:hypothetical protein